MEVLLIAARYLPTDLALVNDIVENVLRNRGTLSALALVAIVWSSVQIFRTLERAINRAWGAPRPRGFWRHLGSSFVMVLSAGLLTGVSLGLTALFGLAKPLNLPFTQWKPLENGLLWSLVSALPPFALTTTLFALLYRYVPHRVRVRWREVWPAALLAALGWELAKKAFALYLVNFARQSYNLLYGSVGVILALMTWVYLTGYIILLGAEFCAVLSRRRGNG